MHFEAARSSLGVNAELLLERADLRAELLELRVLVLDHLVQLLVLRRGLDLARELRARLVEPALEVGVRLAAALLRREQLRARRSQLGCQRAGVVALRRRCQVRRQLRRAGPGRDEASERAKQKP